MINVTEKVPNIPASGFKRVKIVATLGPATNSYEAILALIKSGANAIRLNFSHGNYEEREQQVKWVRKAAEEYGKPVAIIQDLQGPKIRLGDFEGIINVQKGQSLALKFKANYEEDGFIPLQYDLSKKVKRGERIFINDGRIRGEITSTGRGVVHIKVETDGVLTKRKGINLPDTDFKGATITKKDLADLAWGSKNDIDYVAQSFVQTSEEVYAMKRHMKNLGMQAKLIAKFETKAAVENLEEIVNAADVIMIARGDLAIETEPETVPIIQRRLVRMGVAKTKPTIVATQMLYSMVDEPTPTRAEVSDVASAVIMGADALMLSDETAKGKYPIESVMEMKKIILYAQHHSALKSILSEEFDDSKQAAISDALITLAEKVSARAIVAETKSGGTALAVAARRPARPIIAVTSDQTVANQLAIVFGTKSYVRRDERMQATRLANWLRQNDILRKGDIIVTASGMYPGVVGTTDTIKVRILE